MFRVLQSHLLFIPQKHKYRDVAIPKCTQEALNAVLTLSIPETHLKWELGKGGRATSMRTLLCSVWDKLRYLNVNDIASNSSKVCIKIKSLTSK
jgi:hypothetical protein